MNSNSLIKKVIVLIFLLVILIAVFILQGNNFGESYFSWMKMKLIGIGPELNLAEEDSGLDLSDIKIGNASNQEEEIEEVKEVEESVVAEKEMPITDEDIAVIPETSGPSTAEVLLEIEQEINQIAKEIERINIEILKLQNK